MIFGAEKLDLDPFAPVVTITAIIIARIRIVPIRRMGLNGREENEPKQGEFPFFHLGFHFEMFALCI